MSKLIINADDFGYSSGVNYGIVHAHQRGILTSTTIMANMPGFDEAVLLAKENPKLGVGVHLTLTCGKPLRNDVSSIVDEGGKFKDLSFYEGIFKINSEELYREWNEQIKKVIKSGINPTHLDSHHHVNGIEQISDVFIQLAKEYKLPVRNNFNVPKELKTTERFITDFDSLSLSKEIWKNMEINNLIMDCLKYNNIEIMCHPAYVDAFLLSNSSFNINRTFVLKELIDNKYPNIFKENSIKLSHYGQI